MEQLSELILNFGFPIACLVALAKYYAAQRDKQDAAAAAREERLLSHLDRLDQSQHVLLETNATLAREVNVKIDKLIETMQRGE